MAAAQDSHRKLRLWLQWTQAMCVFFGLALLFWGLAPAVIARAVSGESIVEAIRLGAVAMVLGVMFLVLGVVAGRNVGWALWATLGVSVVLFVGNVAAAATSGDARASVFPALMAGCTAGASWLALQCRRSSEEPRSASHAT